MYSKNTYIKILLIWICGNSVHAYTIQAVRAEGIPGDINSEEGRGFRLFQSSKEKKDTGPHATDVGSQQILLTQIKLVMNKAEEIMAIAQSNGLLNQHPMDTTDADSIFPEIQTKEYKMTGPVEHGNPISNDFKLSYGDKSVDGKMSEKELDLATLSENPSLAVHQQSEEALPSNFEHKTEALTTNVDLEKDISSIGASKHENLQSHQQELNTPMETNTAANQISQEMQNTENPVPSPSNSALIADPGILTISVNTATSAPQFENLPTNVVVPVPESLSLEGMPIAISDATPEPLRVETVALPAKETQEQSLKSFFPALFSRSQYEPARSVVIETSGPIIRPMPQQRIFRAPDPMKRGNDPSIIRLVVLPTRGDLPTAAQQDGRAMNQYVLVNPEEPERPERPENPDVDGNGLNGGTEFSVDGAHTPTPQYSSGAPSTDFDEDGLVSGSNGTVTGSNDQKLDEIATIDKDLTKDTPDRNEVAPVTESLEDSLRRYDIAHGYIILGKSKPLTRPTTETRNAIVPMSSPYVIVSQPIAVSNKKRTRVVVPTFLYNFRKPVPVYMSFGRLNPGVGQGGGDDPRLTKEQFFHNPDHALANFKSEYLHHSRGNPIHVLNQMRIDAANPARQFPLWAFRTTTRKDQNQKTKHPSNVFDFIKSIQTRSSRHPVLYMGP